jgi:hypothetical protein
MGMLRVRSLLLILICIFGVTTPAFSQEKDSVCKDSKNSCDTKKVGTDKKPFVVKIYPPSDAEKKTSDERENRKEASEHKLNDLTGKLAEYTKDLSTFTMVLVVIGILQFLVFSFQGWQLKRTVDSAENASVPFLFPAIVNAQDLSSYDEAKTYQPSLDFVFDNHGKTPAIVRSFRAELLAGNLPETRIFDSKTHWKKNYSVIPSETVFRRGQEKPAIPYTKIRMHTELTSKRPNPPPHFFFFGEVIYDDFFEVRHISGFCLKVFLNGLSCPAGGKTYNHIQHKKMSKKDKEPDLDVI